MKVLITGNNGQDGFYLTQQLNKKNYETIGVDLYQDIKNTNQNYCINLSNPNKIRKIILDTKPDQIYNLAAQSNNLIAFKNIKQTHKINYVLVMEILDVLHKHLPSTKLFQAGSSLIFGNNCESDGFQYETTNKDPKTPYGCDKLAAYQLIKTYRQHFDIFAVNGILYNHESPKRSPQFVIPKIVNHVVNNFKNKTQEPLILGDITAIRDWSHASDFTVAFNLMMEHFISDDYICSSGSAHTVNDVIQFIFTYLNYKLPLIIDPVFINQKQENNYIGNNNKLKSIGWRQKYNFETMLVDIINFYINKK